MAAKQHSDGRPDGQVFGQGTTDKIAFHGSTPTSQRTSASLTATASLFALTGASMVAQTTASISGRYAFTSTQLISLVDGLQEIRALLVAYGLHSGGA